MKKLGEILKMTALNLWGLFDFLIIFWAIIYFLQRMINTVTGAVFGKAWVIGTAIIGTPIHELSHALLAIIFGHKIQKIVWFKPQSDGTLGYVIHKYNPENLYQNVGNFFIGIAPLVFGSLALFLLVQILVPNKEEIREYIKKNNDSEDNFALIGNSISLIFNHWNFKSKPFYLFLILSISIANHLVPSVPDIKGALKGAIPILIIVIIISLVASIYNVKKNSSELSFVKKMKKYLIMLFSYTTMILLINFFFAYLICGLIYFFKFGKILLPF